MTSRRTFIRGCAALAASGAVVPALLITRREAIGAETFRALLNSRFVARKGDGERQTLMLVGVDGIRENFSVLFRGDAACPLEQDTYRFAHKQLGELEIFIVPVGRADLSDCYYEAVFNRTPMNESYG